MYACKPVINGYLLRPLKSAPSSQPRSSKKFNKAKLSDLLQFIAPILKVTCSIVSIVNCTRKKLTHCALFIVGPVNVIPTPSVHEVNFMSFL